MKDEAEQKSSMLPSDSSFILHPSSFRVKILDFGLAKAAGAGSEPDANLTASGAIIGTPAYMAPEQASGEKVDGRADLFSLGCVLYEMLAGQRPFTGGNTISILSSLALHTPPAPHTLNPQCPAALSLLVMQLLAKSPTARPASAQAIIDALAEWEVPPSSSSGLTLRVEQPDSENQATAAPARHSVARRRRMALVATVGLLLAGLGGVFFGGTIIRFVTDKGQIVIETDGDNIEVAIKDGQGTVLDKQTKREITFKPGEYDIEVTVTDANGEQRFVTDHFTLTRGGKKSVDARWEVAKAKPAMLPSPVDPDRRAAEWVLSIGGNITINENGKQREIKVTADLPRGAFELAGIMLRGNQRVTDAGLAACAGCQRLTHLDIVNTPVTDAGLTHFSRCKTLVELSLAQTQVTDAGLAHFQGCKNLTSLWLGNTSLTDAGLAHFRDCKNLTLLWLGGTQLSDAGLVHFKNCKNLVDLSLMYTKLTDVGLAHFQGCKNLTNLWLGGTQVSDVGLVHIKDCQNLTLLWLDGAPLTDAGLAHLKDCKNLVDLSLDDTMLTDAGLAHFQNCKHLTNLWLGGTQVSDAGIVHIQDCRNLTHLDLPHTRVSDTGLAGLAGFLKLASLNVKNTKVSEAGVKKLSAALPKCKIEWDDPDRRAAEWALSIGGNIKVVENGEEREIKAVGELPRGAFELSLVIFHVNPNVSDAGLEHLQDCQHLTVFHLYATGVGDAGVAHVKNCKNLKSLSLVSNQVTDAGLVHFQDLKNLGNLGLSGQKVTDAGLANFTNCENLTSLYLDDTKITATGVAKLKNLKDFKHLVLNGAHVNDALLANFKECQDLVWLNINSPSVTDAGLAHFRDCKNFSSALSLNCPQMTDAGLAHFKDCKYVTYFNLDGTQVSDAGLADLAGLQSLIGLGLFRTRISLHGYEQLKIALPKCPIIWSEPNRSVAESVLALGGSIEVGKPGLAIANAVKTAADLPADYFQVRRVSLAGVNKPLDKLPDLWPLLSGLSSAKFDQLDKLDLSGITGLNYDFLIPIHGLRELSLANAGLNDATLAQLPKLPALERLVLDGNEIRGAGLVHLSGRTEWIDLSLGCPSVVDLFAQHLAELKHVKRLSLAGSGLSDAGIKHLAGLTTLESLDLRRTKATAAGIAALQQTLPKCRIESDEMRAK